MCGKEVVGVGGIVLMEQPGDILHEIPMQCQGFPSAFMQEWSKSQWQVHHLLHDRRDRLLCVPRLQNLSSGPIWSLTQNANLIPQRCVSCLEPIETSTSVFLINFLKFVEFVFLLGSCGLQCVNKCGKSLISCNLIPGYKTIKGEIFFKGE